MSESLSSFKTIRIRKGDSTIRRVRNIVSSLNKDDSTPILLINKDNSFQKVIAVIEKVKVDLATHKIPFHQYNKLGFTTENPSSSETKSAQLNSHPLQKHTTTKCLPSISIIISKNKIEELDSDISWEYQCSIQE